MKSLYVEQEGVRQEGKCVCVQVCTRACMLMGVTKESKKILIFHRWRTKIKYETEKKSRDHSQIILFRNREVNTGPTNEMKAVASGK